MKLFFLSSIVLAALTPLEFNQIIQDFAKKFESLNGHNILGFNLKAADEAHLFSFDELSGLIPKLTPTPPNYLTLVNIGTRDFIHRPVEDVINHDIKEFHPEIFKFYHSLMKDNTLNKSPSAKLLGAAAAGGITAGGIGGWIMNEKMNQQSQ